MAQVQSLLVLVAAAVLLFIAVKWVVLWRRFNAAAASARAEAQKRAEHVGDVNHLNIDNQTSED